ncbi:MAG: calcium-binding protein, partial [Cyanobacteria bacterium M5B4]
MIATAGGMIVNGNKGDDLVIGFGNSTVYGGQANDTIYGAEGTANGDLGADLIFGGATM